jgi:rubrerythrin
VDQPGYDAGRRAVLATLAAGTFAATFAVVAGPAQADTALDVQILQTASSLERLAIDTYAALLAPGGAAGATLAAVAPPAARDAISSFLTTTMSQHGDHLRALQAQTAALGGATQNAPNSRFQQAMASQLAGLTDPKTLVDVAAALEKVATDTYLTNLSVLQDRRSKEIVAGLMAVEAQHLATLRVFGTLLASPALIAVPLPQAALAALPGTVCTQAFPDAIHRVNGPDGVADPASGAVR